MSQTRRADHEEALVKAFFIAKKQERWLGLLANPKRRRDILECLPSLSDLDSRHTLEVPPPQTSRQIVEMLRERGAGPDAYLISESSALDMQTLPLAEAVGALVGMGMATLVSCIPGQLGYFEGEHRLRLILERRAATR
jgi:hypothetical protein